jgi:hypothetical protein
LDLGPKGLIDLVRERFEINVPDYLVKNEIPGKGSKYGAEARERIDGFIQGGGYEVIGNEKYRHCLDVTEKWLTKKGWIGAHHSIDEGERHCVGASLFLSRQRGKQISLITDDFKFIEDGKACEFFEEQGIGRIMTTLDLILHFYSTIRYIGRDQVQAAFQDFFNVLPFKEQNKMKTSRRYFTLLNERCRALGYSAQLCKMECLSQSLP